MSAWQTACASLRGKHGDVLLIGGTRTLLSWLCLIFCVWAELRLHRLLEMPVISGWLSAEDLFLISVLAAAALIQLPLRIQTDRQIGRLTASLDGCDLGFLRLSSNVWLWARAVPVRLLAGLLGLLAWLPSFLLLTAAKSLWQTVPPDTESILPLLGVLHLLLFAAAALFLPLRMYAVSAALPLSFLKSPHRSAFFVLHDAFRRTKHCTFRIIAGRLLCFPLILLPPFGVIVLPRLLAAEMTLSAENSA